MDKYADIMFRRQFILGTRESAAFGKWVKNMIDGRFFLYTHPELGINHLKSGDREIYILGYILDPYNPALGNDEILKEIILNCSCFDTVLSYTDKYSGRWVLIWKDGEGVRIMNDACGTRQIYYYSCRNEIWCGSQPSIIAFELGLEEAITPDLKEFLSSAEFKRECAWIGDGSAYENIMHLLPNHYLNLENAVVRRFWPLEELAGMDMASAVRETAGIIRGTILSICSRFDKVMMSVTAGMDSRMNLAAGKPVSGRFKYIFCMEGTNSKSTDYKISSRLLARLNLKQDIIGLCEADRGFDAIYNKNVTAASGLPSKRFIYSFYKKYPGYIHVSGVGAGIAKSFYHNDNSRMSTDKICSAAGHRNSAYVKRYVSRWLEDAESIAYFKTINIYDVFYWEQRMGNWGAKSCAEQDIAIEETWPYNNRKLLSVMLSVDSKYRRPPFYKFHRRIIGYLWKDALCVPVNPNFKKKTYYFVKNGIDAVRAVLSTNS